MLHTGGYAAFLIPSTQPPPAGDPQLPSIAPWTRLLDQVLDHRRRVLDLPVVPTLPLPAVGERIEKVFDFESGISMPELVDATWELMTGGSVHVTSPRYFGLFNPSVLEAGIIADAIVSAMNPQLAVRSHAPAALEIEDHTLRFLGSRLGLDMSKAHATFTTGGAEANLSAILVALSHRFPEHLDGGTGSIQGMPAIYVSEQSHHSLLKAARMTGLGARCITMVRTDRHFRMCPEDLARCMIRDDASGRRPFLVVATAGSTGTGAIDPLPEVTAVARGMKAWVHVDAAYGGAAILSDRLKVHLEGIQEADSVTWDAHKWLSVPMGTGMFFTRHEAAALRAFSVSASYMPGEGGQRPDPYLSTVQWSRRAIGMRLAMVLANRGLKGMAELVETQTDVGEQLRIQLQGRGWRIVNSTPFPVICFTPSGPARRIDEIHQILKQILQRGNTWISRVQLPGIGPALRACITSYLTTPKDVAFLLDELDHARDEALN